MLTLGDVLTTVGAACGLVAVGCLSAVAVDVRFRVPRRMSRADAMAVLTSGAFFGLFAATLCASGAAIYAWGI